MAIGAGSALERVARLELASSAWKAEVLPLNYTREYFAKLLLKWELILPISNVVEGGGVEPPKLTRQIYSLIPLATREPLQKRGARFCPCLGLLSIKI